MSTQFYSPSSSSLYPQQQQPPKPSIDKFKYNSTTLYKNNLPIYFDIDSICEDLYNCANNKTLFNEIMSGIEKDVLSSETKKKEIPQQITPSRPTGYNSNSNYYQGYQRNQKVYFRNTVPEGELINSGPYMHKSFHKKYTDVNANTKYYFPNESTNPMMRTDVNKSQWTNRANRIILDSHNFNSGNISSNNNRTIRPSNSMLNYAPNQDGFGNNANFGNNVSPLGSSTNLMGGIKNTTSYTGGI